MREENGSNDSSDGEIGKCKAKFNGVEKLLRELSIAASHFDGVTKNQIAILERVRKFSQEHANHSRGVACTRINKTNDNCRLKEGASVFETGEKMGRKMSEIRTRNLQRDDNSP